MLFVEDYVCARSKSKSEYFRQPHYNKKNQKDL